MHVIIQTLITNFQRGVFFCLFSSQLLKGVNHSQGFKPICADADRADSPEGVKDWFPGADPGLRPKTKMQQYVR